MCVSQCVQHQPIYFYFDQNLFQLNHSKHQHRHTSFAEQALNQRLKVIKETYFCLKRKEFYCSHHSVFTSADFSPQGQHHQTEELISSLLLHNNCVFKFTSIFMRRDGALLISLLSVLSSFNGMSGFAFDPCELKRLLRVNTEI